MSASSATRDEMFGTRPVPADRPAAPLPDPFVPASEMMRASFTGGAIVQLATDDPDRPDAVVVPLHPAVVRVTDRRVVGVVGAVEWSWLLRDLVRVSHGRDEPWTILAVPDVPDHGVAVRPEDAVEFRRALDEVLGRPVVAVSPRADAPTGQIAIDLSDAAPPGDVVSSSPTAGDAAATPSTSTRPRPNEDPTAPPSPAAGLAGLEARAISAWFGSHHVLDRVSLEMPAGRVMALIGPSGCGKSTFLRILNRMHEMIPSASLAGQVLLDGADIYDPKRRLTDARRQVGMVFQKPNPFPAMSIYDNVIAGFRLTGTKVSSDEKDHVVESCLRKAGLWSEVRDRLRQPGGGLSGGQQQRLCIARALAIRPRVLLMDEPCSALDPTSTRRIEETITEIVDEVTVVIVTHNMQQAARVSHTCAFFLAEQGTPGVIVEHGPTGAMFGSPQDQRTSDYVNGRFG